MVFSLGAIYAFLFLMFAVVPCPARSCRYLPRNFSLVPRISISATYLGNPRLTFSMHRKFDKHRPLNA